MKHLRIHYRSALCPVIALLVFARPAHAQHFQKALDTTTTSVGMVGGITSTTDGGYIMVLNTDSGEVQWKADASGQAVWAKHYSLGSANRARMPDGGIVFGELGTFIQGDTSYAHYKIVRTDASGDVQWSKLLTLEKTTPTKSPYTTPIIASDANGAMLIAVGFSGASSTQEWFVSLNGSGALLWSRFYSLNATTFIGATIATDGNAGWFFAFNDQATPSMFLMGHLSFLGTIQWYNSFTYDVLGTQVQVGALISVNGQAVVGGYLGAGVGPWFIMKANFDGSMAWYTAYSGGQAPGITRMGSLPSGELVASGGYPQFGIDAIVHTAPDGSILNSSGQLNITDTQYNYTSRWQDWDIRDTSIDMSAYLVRTDLMLGTNTYWPAIWKLSALPAGCLTSTASLVSTVIPFSDVQVQPEPPLTDMATILTITDSVVAVVPVALVNTHEYCSFITSVPEVQNVGNGFHVVGNLVEQGTAIVCTSAIDSFMEVFDASARQLATMHLSTASANEIPTSDWRSGLYLLRATDAHGRIIGTARVVVE